jgi:hypothetical protein
MPFVTTFIFLQDEPKSIPVYDRCHIFEP